MFIHHVKHYHQWLCSAIHFKTKSCQISSDSVRIQGPSKRPSSGHLYPASSFKERNRKGGKCKICLVLQSPVPSPQASPRWKLLIDLNRLNTFLLVEKFKMETPESIRTSLIPGEWASSIDLSDAYLHIPIHPNWVFFVCGLRIPSRFSPCKTHTREMAQTSGFDPTSQVKTCFDCKMFDVVYWVACLNREDGPKGCLHMRPFQFHLKEHWRFIQSLDNLPWSETMPPRVMLQGHIL